MIQVKKEGENICGKSGHHKSNFQFYHGRGEKRKMEEDASKEFSLSFFLFPPSQFFLSPWPRRRKRWEREAWIGNYLFISSRRRRRRGMEGRSPQQSPRKRGKRKEKRFGMHQQHKLSRQESRKKIQSRGKELKSLKRSILFFREQFS